MLCGKFQRWRPDARLEVGILGVLLLVCAGFAATPPGERLVDTAIQIDSTPPGAFVMLSFGAEFNESTALALGQTPIVRYMPLRETGVAVHVTRAGYQEWSGQISPFSPKTAATLTLFSEGEKNATGRTVAGKCKRLTVLPVLVGARRIGRETDQEASSQNTAKFENAFFGVFERLLSERFQGKAAVKRIPELQTTNCWSEIAAQLQGVRVEKIGFYPQPLKFADSQQLGTALTSPGEAVLLMRAEAYYLGKGARFGRAAVPILLTAGSAAVAQEMAQNMANSDATHQAQQMAASGRSGSVIGYGYAPYFVFEPSANRDLIIVQMLLVDSETKEIMWFGQVAMPDYFARKGVTEETARKAAEQIPARFIE